MPQIELKYTNDIALDLHQLFVAIETTINDADSTAGECKSRAYRIDDFLHTHVFLSIQMLNKSHRNDDFMKKLLSRIDKLITSKLPSECFYSIKLEFLPEYYITAKA